MLVKSKSIPIVPQFAPVELTITFQSQQEIEAFYALFNHPNLTQFEKEHGLQPEKIRHELFSDNYVVYNKLRESIRNASHVGLK
jgi:hypothetical protein